MKKLVFLLSILLISISSSFAQTAAEKELIQLSTDKWQWMSDKDVDKLEKLFDAKAKFSKFLFIASSAKIISGFLFYSS